MRTLHKKFLWTFWNIGILYCFFSFISNFLITFKSDIIVRKFPSFPIKITEEYLINYDSSFSIVKRNTKYLDFQNAYYLKSNVEDATLSKGFSKTIEFNGIIDYLKDNVDNYLTILKVSDVANISFTNINYTLLSSLKSTNIEVDQLKDFSFSDNYTLISDLSPFNIEFSIINKIILYLSKINDKILMNINFAIFLDQASTNLLGDIDDITLGELDSKMLFKL